MTRDDLLVDVMNSFEADKFEFEGEKGVGESDCDSYFI